MLEWFLEGIILKDEEILEEIRKEAGVLLSKGPAPWSVEDIRIKRYFLADLLDNFIGNTCRAEGIFIASSLVELIGESILRSNNHGLGTESGYYVL